MCSAALGNSRGAGFPGLGSARLGFAPCPSLTQLLGGFGEENQPGMGLQERVLLHTWISLINLIDLLNLIDLISLLSLLNLLSLINLINLINPLPLTPSAPVLLSGWGPDFSAPLGSVKASEGAPSLLSLVPLSSR